MPIIHGVCQMDLTESDPGTGKPYLRLEFPDGVVVCLTLNIGEMIGGAAKGAQRRWEDLQAGRDPVQEFMNETDRLVEDVTRRGDVLAWLHSIATFAGSTPEAIAHAKTAFQLLTREVRV